AIPTRRSSDLAHLRPVVLAHDLVRHLARPEPLEPGGPPDLLQARFDLALDLRARDADRQTALQPCGLLHRDVDIRFSHHVSNPFSRLYGGFHEPPADLGADAGNCPPRTSTRRSGASRTLVESCNPGAKGETRTPTGCPTGT